MLTTAITNRALSVESIGFNVFSNTAKSFGFGNKKKKINYKTKSFGYGLNGKESAYLLPYLS